MGSGIFIMGAHLHLARGDCIYKGLENHLFIMGSGIFIMGGHLHLARGDCISAELAKPPRLLWAVGFL